jgi:hypothetical protein
MFKNKRVDYLPDELRLIDEQRQAIYDQTEEMINEGTRSSQKLSEEQIQQLADAACDLHNDMHDAINQYMNVVITNCNIRPTPIDVCRVNVMVLRMFLERFVIGLLVSHKTGEVTTIQLLYYMKRYLNQFTTTFILGCGKNKIDLSDLGDIFGDDL